MSSSSSDAELGVNTVGLIIGVSVVGFILLIIVVILIAICIRRKCVIGKRDRRHLYLAPAGASPFGSLGAAPSNSAINSYSANNSYGNNALATGELRQNPLADQPFFVSPIQQGVSLISIPPGEDPRRGSVLFQPRLATSSQSIYRPNGDVMDDTRASHAFVSKLYENLIDTIHEHKGRPLYLCKRSDYSKSADYFDIIGRTRVGDWLIRPRPNVPDRPRKRGSKKRQAPKANVDRMANGGNQPSSNGGPAANGRPAVRKGGQGLIATPFGAASRMPTRYLSGSNLAMNNPAYEQPMYTSLPRDLDRQRQYRHDRPAHQPSHQSGAKMDERLYSQVLKKHDLPNASPIISERKNPNRSRNIGSVDANPRVGEGRTEAIQGHRERSGSNSTLKSLGITDQFRFLDQYDTEEERF